MSTHAVVSGSPELPPEEKVLKKKTYHYAPCPTDVPHLLEVQLLHEYFTPGVHLDDFWVETFPKKLGGKLHYKKNLTCVGWGVHIIEKLNWLPVFLLATIFIVLSGLFAILYSALKADISGGFTVGAYVLTTLMLMFMTWQLKWQSELNV